MLFNYRIQFVIENGRKTIVEHQVYIHFLVEPVDQSFNSIFHLVHYYIVICGSISKPTYTLLIFSVWWISLVVVEALYSSAHTVEVVYMVFRDIINKIVMFTYPNKHCESQVRFCCKRGITRAK